MKVYTVRKSRGRSLRYLFIVVALLVFTVSQLITDKTEYPRGKSFYWVGIVLFGGSVLYLLYDLLDKRPLLIIDDKGIGNGRNWKILWKDISHFKCESSHTRHFTHKQIDIFGPNAKKIASIDVSYADFSLDRLERILKGRVKKKR